MLKKYFLSLIMAVFFVFFGFNSASAESAKLFLYPSSGEYNVGENFTIQVMTDSGGGSGINAGSAEISFDTNYLLVKEVTKTGSIFDLWTSSPTFSNKSGLISFSGGLIPPPYKGDNGTIVSITFMSLQTGDTQVNFNSGMITASDGKGTDILDGMLGSNFTFVEKETGNDSDSTKENESSDDRKTGPSIDKESADMSTGLLPPPPKIESDSHPDEDNWYTGNTAKFSWKLLADVIGVSRMLTDSPSSNPGPSSDGTDETMEFTDLKDGKHYFHIKFQNQNGWGPITHRKVLIDSTSPHDIKIEIDNGDDLTNPNPKISFSAKDDTSGIAEYVILLDDEDIKESLKKVEADKYLLPTVDPGKHVLTILAKDNAGNEADFSADFIVEALKIPVISSVPGEINKDEKLIIRGTSFYPDATMRLFIKKQGSDVDPMVHDIKTNKDGAWSYFHTDILEKGIYYVSAKVVDSRGASSNETERIIFVVNSISIVSNFGVWIIMVLILMILLLLSLIFYNQHMFTKKKHSIESEIDELRRRYSEVFSALREEVSEIIEIADKKPGLSESEKRVKTKLVEALDISEEFIGKETDDIEKELE